MHFIKTMCQGQASISLIVTYRRLFFSFLMVKKVTV